MTEYTYNADDDTMDLWAKNFTNRLDNGEGDHEAEYLDILKLLFATKKEGALLDIGAGLGRVTALASGNIKEIVALEPDSDRHSYTYNNFHNPPACQVLNQMSSEYIADHPTRKFDIIVLGMVIQHIPTDAFHSLVKDTSELIKDDGVVIIATTHTLESTKGFTYSAPAKDEHYISEEVFNKYANDTRNNSKGIPVRRFSKNELITAVEPFFETIMWRQFSYYRDDSIAYFADFLNISVEELKDTGDSQFLIMQKKAIP